MTKQQQEKQVPSYVGLVYDSQQAAVYLSLASVRCVIIILF